MSQEPIRQSSRRMAQWRTWFAAGLALVFGFVLLVRMYQIAPYTDFTYISIGNRPATLVTAWRPWKTRTRALMIVGADFKPPMALIGTTAFDNHGIYLDGKVVRRWDQPYIILVGISADGKPLLRDVPFDRQRLEWLNSDDPESNSRELDRLDQECARLESSAMHGGVGK